MSSKPPPADDPALRRTCTRCYTARNWTGAHCPRCKNPAFMLPEAAEREGCGIQVPLTTKPPPRQLEMLG